MVEFPHFEHVAPLEDESLLDQLGAVGFPPEIIEAWRRYGTGFVDPDGIVRLIDPEHYFPLDEFFDDATGAIPFAATGLGDLLVWQEGIIKWVVYRTVHVVKVSFPADVLLGHFSNPEFLDVNFWRQRYLEAVAVHGRPDLYEAFYYTPFLAIGGLGFDDAKHMQRGDLMVSLSLFSQMAMRISLAKLEL